MKATFFKGKSLSSITLLKFRHLMRTIRIKPPDVKHPEEEISFINQQIMCSVLNQPLGQDQGHAQEFEMN